MIKKVIKIQLDKDSRIIVVFQREKTEIINFVVVLETKIKNFKENKNEWMQVLRFDNAHGYPHMDKLDKNGNKIEVVKVDYLTNKEALSIAVDLIKNNYNEFISAFLNRNGE
ncbi:MAG: hypothetical protein M1480_10645 [Bacteroidetes bacterium]|nr:hypothetical protein [Bacteroidota bacterium]